MKEEYGDDTGRSFPEEEFPAAVFSVADVMYGLSSRHMLSIEILGTVTPIVGSPPHMIGVTDFRGDMISLIDLRALFGIRSMAEQLREFMLARIADHERWMAALEKAADEGGAFTLATDPHACAFGKWYDSFHTDSNSLNMLLKKIDSPHQKLHTSAVAVKKAIADGRLEEARELVRAAKATHFSETISLLRRVDEAYESDSTAMLIVLEVDGHVFGLVADKIVSVEFITEPVPLPDGGQRSEYVEKLGRRSGDGAIVQFLDVRRLSRT